MTKEQEQAMSAVLTAIQEKVLLPLGPAEASEVLMNLVSEIEEGVETLRDVHNL